MQITHARSTSKKSGRCSRDSPDIRQKSNNYLLATKMGDSTLRNQTTYSKELDNRKHKNPADNTQYIRNLYKKYLGKQNNNSDRKTKTDAKDIKAEKVLFAEQCKQKLSYGQELQMHRVESALEKSCHQNSTSVFKKMSSVQEVVRPSASKTNKMIDQPKTTNFYKNLLDNEIVNIIGDKRSSLVLAMQTINAIRRKNG